MAAALEDHRAAPISERLKAALDFLELLTLRPHEVDEDAVQAAADAGVEPDALRDAIEVAAAFNVIDRVADALDFEPQTESSLRMSARQLISRGYA